MNLNYIIFFLSFCLLAFMLYKEFVRVKKVRLVFRILASVLGVLAMVFLWFPLKYTSTQAIKENQTLASADKSALQNAKGILIEAASQNPATYLSALKLMNQSKKFSFEEIELIENALQKLIKPLQSLPQAKSRSAKSNLGESYLKNLKNAN